MAGKDKLRIAALKGLTGSIIATLVVRWVAVTMLDIPPEFLPLATPGPTIFFTAVGAIGAAGVFAVVRRRARRPASVFRRVALVVLLFSLPPDLWLLSDGAATSIPVGTPTGVGVLMLMHVVTAVVIVWALTGGGDLDATEGTSSS